MGGRLIQPKRILLIINHKQFPPFWGAFYSPQKDHGGVFVLLHQFPLDGIVSHYSDFLNLFSWLERSRLDLLKKVKVKKLYL